MPVTHAQQYYWGFHPGSTYFFARFPTRRDAAPLIMTVVCHECGHRWTSFRNVNSVGSVEETGWDCITPSARVNFKTAIQLAHELLFLDPIPQFTHPGVDFHEVFSMLELALIKDGISNKKSIVSLRFQPTIMEIIYIREHYPNSGVQLLPSNGRPVAVGCELLRAFVSTGTVTSLGIVCGDFRAGGQIDTVWNGQCVDWLSLTRVVELGSVFYQLIGGCKNLSRLEVSEAFDVDEVQLADCLVSGRLRHLSLVDTDIGDEFCSRAFAKTRPLLHADFSGTHVSDSGVSRILSTCNELEVLGLSGTQISDESVSAFGKHPNLRCVAIGGTQFSANAIESVRHLHPMLEMVPVLPDYDLRSMHGCAI